MTQDDLRKLIAECKANEAALNQQLQQVVANINKMVGAREMAQHLLNEMNKPVDATKVKRRRAVKDDEKAEQSAITNGGNAGQDSLSERDAA